MLDKLPKLYDHIYEQLPIAYNSTGGKFGRITRVKMFDGKDKYKENPATYLRTRPKTPIYQKEVTYQYPDGFIMPLVYSLSALMEVNGDEIEWITDPFNFVNEKLGTILDL